MFHTLASLRNWCQEANWVVSNTHQISHLKKVENHYSIKKKLYPWEKTIIPKCSLHILAGQTLSNPPSAATPSTCLSLHHIWGIETGHSEPFLLMNTTYIPLRLFSRPWIVCYWGVFDPSSALPSPPHPSYSPLSLFPYFIFGSHTCVSLYPLRPIRLATEPPLPSW